MQSSCEQYYTNPGMVTRHAHDESTEMEKMDHTDEELSYPASLAFIVKNGVEQIWVDIMKAGTADDLWNEFIEPPDEPIESGEERAEQFNEFLQLPKEDVAELAALLNDELKEEGGDIKPMPLDVARMMLTQFSLLDIAAVYALETLRAAQNGESELVQWGYAAQALVYFGKLQGHMLCDAQARLTPATSVLAMLGVEARHKENRAMKKEAFDWLSKHMGKFSSMDDAAEAMGRIVPMKFSTRRSWVSSFAKTVSRDEK